MTEAFTWTALGLRLAEVSRWLTAASLTCAPLAVSALTTRDHWQRPQLPDDTALDLACRSTAICVVLGVISAAAIWALFFYRTSQKALNLALADRERWAFALERSGLVVWEWDVAGELIWFSQGWSRLTGAESGLASPLERAHRFSPDEGKELDDLLQSLLAGHIKEFTSEHSLKTNSGEERWVLERVGVLSCDASGRVTRVLATIEDVSSQRANQAKLARLASHDNLTGLPSRTLFDDRLNQALARAERNQTMVAVVFLDVDHFKRINDSFGHRTGDQILIGVANLLTSCLRKSDTVSRRGGDEFVVVLPDLDSPTQAICACEKLLLRLREPLEIEGNKIALSMSIGVAIYPNDERDSSTLLHLADMALYRSKKAGRRRVTFHSPSFNPDVARRQPRSDDSADGHQYEMSTEAS